MTRTTVLLLVCVGMGCVTAHARAQSLLVNAEAELERALADFDQAQEWQTSAPDRARPLFRSSAERFQNLLGTGVINGRLEYNLGNCYLQLGDVGRAILHYRRAERLIPADPRLADNLKLARSRCLTTIRPTRRTDVLRTIFFLHYDLAWADRARIAVALYVAMWFLLILRRLTARRSAAVLAMLCGLIAVSLLVSMGASRWSDRNAPAGVITSMDVVAHKGPGTGYGRQFEQPLQPGVEFVRRDQRGGWWLIALPDGKTGWVESSSAELVPDGV